MRRYKSPVSGLKSGVASGLGRLRNSSQIITADTSPVLAALDDADTPAAGFTSGIYASTAGTISSETAVYLVDGLPQAGSFDLTAGEIVQVREDVVDSAANERSFFTAMRIVDAYPVLSIPEALPGGQTTATGLAVYTTSSTGTLHVGIYPAAATPTAAEIEAGTGAVVHDTKTITVDGRRTFLDQSGLTAGTSYKAWFAHRNEAGSLSAAIGSAAFSTHEATPVLSAATAAANGSDGVTNLGVSTTIGNGAAYVGIYTSDVTPTTADIINGIGAAAWASKEVTTSGPQTFPNLTGLTTDVDYKAWYAQENVDDYPSDVLASAVFTTSSAVPVLSSPTTVADSQTSVTTIAVTTDTGSGTLNWGIYPSASTPSSADIKAGTGAVVYGSQAVTATGAQAVADQSGLSAAEDYKTWFVQGLSTPVATSLYVTWPDVINVDGELTFVANSNGTDVDLIVTIDSVEKFNDTITMAQYQADEFNLVAPVISGVAVEGETLTRTAAGLWLYNTTSMNALTANWRRDTVDIPGETGTTYLVVPADEGTTLDYAEDLGVSTVDSNDISIPAPPTYNEMNAVAGLTWWLDADDAASVTESGGTVTAWADKVGSNNGTAAGTPRWGDTTQNGKKVIDLVAASVEYFSFAHGAVPDADEAATVFLVARANQGRDSYFWNGGSGTVGYSCGFRNGTAELALAYGTIWYWGSDNQFLWNTTPDAWNVYTVITNGTTSRKVYQNGVLLVNDVPTVAADPGATTNYIGKGYSGNEAFNGSYAEIGRYNSVLSTANLNAVGSNLAIKWATNTWNTIT